MLYINNFCCCGKVEAIAKCILPNLDVHISADLQERIKLKKPKSLLVKT